MNGLTAGSTRHAAGAVPTFSTGWPIMNVQREDISWAPGPGLRQETFPAVAPVAPDPHARVRDFRTITADIGPVPDDGQHRCRAGGGDGRLMQGHAKILDILRDGREHGFVRRGNCWPALSSIREGRSSCFACARHAQVACVASRQWP